MPQSVMQSCVMQSAAKHLYLDTNLFGCVVR